MVAKSSLALPTSWKKPDKDFFLSITTALPLPAGPANVSSQAPGWMWSSL